MKKVTLKRISLVNFRGHKDFTTDFSDRTEISGDNRLGKSTIFDAFIWVLFGKDQFDRKDFEIIPIVDNKRLDRVDPQVTITIAVDGVETTLRRELHQKWVRRRGTTEEVFDGCDTLYYFNDVPLKASEYKLKIDAIIEETVFKLITNPAAFLGLHWQKQREFLFSIAGTVSDIEVASSDPKFARLLEVVNGKSLVDFKREISSRKKKLNDDLSVIQPKIDQTTRLMPVAVDFVAIEKEVKEIDEQIAAVDLKMSDKAAAIRGQYEEIQRKQGQINDLKTKQSELVNAKDAEAKQKAFNDSQSRIELGNDVTAAFRKVKEEEKKRDELSDKLVELTKKKDAKSSELIRLRSEWEGENAKEYKPQEGCLICPVFGEACGDTSAIGKHEEFQVIAKDAFFKAKDKRLDEINGEGQKQKAELEKLSTDVAEVEKQLKDATESVLKLLSDHEVLKTRYDSTQIEAVVKINPMEVEGWMDYQDKIDAISATILEVKPVDNSEFQQQKAELTGKRDILNKSLGDRDLIVKFKAEIKSLEEQASSLAQQVADLERTEFTIDAFNKAKIDECELRVNSLFEIVRFQLFDKTIDGNEFEACIATNKVGVPIAATNTAEKINAGLDIIRTLSNFYNVSAPIFADGSESVNEYINTGSQMIFLRVTREKKLTISNQ